MPHKTSAQGLGGGWYKSSTYIGKKNWHLLILPKMTIISLLSLFANLEQQEAHSVKVCNPSSQWKAGEYASRHITRFAGWTAVSWEEKALRNYCMKQNVSCHVKFSPCQWDPKATGKMVPALKELPIYEKRMAHNQAILVNFLNVCFCQFLSYCQCNQSFSCHWAFSFLCWFCLEHSFLTSKLVPS